jgi:hypothetical protein
MVFASCMCATAKDSCPCIVHKLFINLGLLLRVAQQICWDVR